VSRLSPRRRCHLLLEGEAVRQSNSECLSICRLSSEHVVHGLELPSQTLLVIESLLILLNVSGRQVVMPYEEVPIKFLIRRFRNRLLHSSVFASPVLKLAYRLPCGIRHCSYLRVLSSLGLCLTKLRTLLTSSGRHTCIEANNPRRALRSGR